MKYNYYISVCERSDHTNSLYHNLNGIIEAENIIFATNLALESIAELTGDVINFSINKHTPNAMLPASL